MWVKISYLLLMESLVALEVSGVGVSGNYQSGTSDVHQINEDSDLAPACACRLCKEKVQHKKDGASLLIMWQKYSTQGKSRLSLQLLP